MLIVAGNKSSVYATEMVMDKGVVIDYGKPPKKRS